MDCKGKTYLVFGGLGGIGYATCIALLRKCAKNIGIFDVIENDGKVKKLADSYPNANIRFWKCEATNKEQVDQGFKAALSEFGTIDVVVNCVGVVDEANPERCIEINLLASVYINYACIDYMSISKGYQGGTVANVASMAGLEPLPATLIYSATKFGLVGLSRSLGSDFFFEKTGIKFITICPGYTVTPLVRKDIDSPLHDERELPGAHTAQTAQICGELLVEALQTNKNGSLWKVARSSLSEIIPPSYRSQKPV